MSKYLRDSLNTGDRISIHYKEKKPPIITIKIVALSSPRVSELLHRALDGAIRRVKERRVIKTEIIELSQSEFQLFDVAFEKALKHSVCKITDFTFEQN